MNTPEDVQKDDTIIRSEMLVGRECHSIHTTAQRANEIGQLIGRLIIPSERQFRSINIRRLRFTCTWKRKTVLEPGREFRKASCGRYQCRNQKYEWGERWFYTQVTACTKASIQPKAQLRWKESRSPEWWYNMKKR